MSAAAGTILTCSHHDCGCRIEVIRPCPQGDGYTCACGHPLTPEEREPLPPTPGA